MVWRVALYAVVMGAVIVVTGSQLLDLFGITVDQFRIAGGLVLFQIGWTMLNGHTATSHQGTQKEQAEESFAKQVAFYPITFPMIVGPGTISTIVVFTAQADTLAGEAGVAAALGLVLAVLIGSLLLAPTLGRVLGQTARSVVSRLMGMILLAIAASMIAAGLRAVFPGLAGAGLAS